MSASQSENSPWPVQTPPPTPLLSYKRSKRKRTSNNVLHPRGSSSKLARQIVTDSAEVAAAKTQCQLDSGNAVISCFPTADTVIPQHQWATFVWNSRRPEITQTNLVDIFLFHGDSLMPFLHYANQFNDPQQAGSVTAQVNDSWWGDNGSKWAGVNISYPFYWVIIRSDDTLDGSEVPQATFSAVQTTFADSIIASMASTSAAAASSSSLASVESAASAASVRSKSSSGSASIPTNGSGSVQSAESDSAFPHWAIAVIVVLGFLAITAACILAFLILRRVRRRSQMDSNRNSMGSASPMIENTQSGTSPQSPLLASSVAHVRDLPSVGYHAPSVVSPDGASTISRANSAGDSGPFSGADAAIMADAFRKALRKPDFADRPVEEGESPDTQGKEELLNRELAEEGRDIRSVSSSRGVKVETLSDSGDTVQDNPH